MEVIQLALRCQYTPDEYFYYRFYEKDKDYKYMLYFLSNFYSLEYFHPAMSDAHWKKVIGNKLLFNIYYGKYGFPVTNIYGYYDHKAGFTFEGLPLNCPDQFKKFLLKAKPSSVVIKPVSGSKGKDLIIIDEIDY